MKLAHTSLRMPAQFSVNIDQCAAIALMLYFTNSLWQHGMQFLIGNDYVGGVVAKMLPYVFVAGLILICPQRFFRFDFLLLMTAVGLFFGFTLMAHPNYLPYYQRETFGVWDHVLSPHRGIYAFLFVRFFRNPKELQKALKFSGYFMLIYFTFRIYEAMKRGYWLGVGVNSSGMIKMQYSVTFGYEVLPFALLFLYCALSDKKLIDFIIAGIMIVMILIGGSRGPVLFIGVFFALYLLLVISQSRKKALIIGTSAVVIILLAVFYRNLLQILINILDGFGFSSRFFTTLLDGTVTDDNNRAEIWAAAIRMIQENPFGYGAMGSRHQITKYIYAGYPHNIILEILIDFGVIPGAVIILLLIWNGYKVLFQEQYSEWRPVAFPYFSATGALMGSMTYWSVPYFWVSVAVIISALQYSKKTQQTKFFLKLMKLQKV